MKTKKTLIIYALLLINSTFAFSQYEQFFTVDDNSLLAIDLKTNSNYNGTCEQFFSNKQIAWQMTIEDGTPLEMKSWHKNGQLADSTIYMNGFNLFKRFTFDHKGRVITEELLEMKSIAQSSDKKVKKMAAKKRHAYSTVYEDCLSLKTICYSKNNTPQYINQIMYNQSKTLLVQYHQNGNVSDSTFYTHKSIGDSKYTPVKDGTSVAYDLAGNKCSEKVFVNNKLVKETVFDTKNTALIIIDNKEKLTEDALHVSENDENVKVCVKQNWQANTIIYQ